MPNYLPLMDHVSQPRDGLINWLLPPQPCLPQQTALLCSSRSMACTLILSQHKTSTGSHLIFSTFPSTFCLVQASSPTASPPTLPPPSCLQRSRLDDLLALLEVYFAPEKEAPPGGTATKAELEALGRLPLLSSLPHPPPHLLLPTPVAAAFAAALGGPAVFSRPRRLERLFWTPRPILFHLRPLLARRAYGAHHSTTDYR